MINVKSEYGKLKKVLLHRPGEETSNLTPSTYEELLFEDAYFLPQAQKEHDAFADVLIKAGVEVVYIEDLVAEVFDQNPEAKVKFFEQFIVEAGIVKGTPLFQRALKYIEGFTSNKELVIKIIEGVRYTELPSVDSTNVSLREQTSNDIWAFEPLPNLIFQRDPFASIGNGISLHYMGNNTRRRETLFASYVFEYHTDYKNTPKYFDRINPDQTSLEGGDVMVLTEKELALGISERTSADAAEKLAKNIFADKDSLIDTIYGINIPKGRAWMHLDTVFTQIDKDKFSIFSTYPFEIFKMVSNENGGLNISKITMKMEDFLSDIFGVENVELIQAGKGDVVYAEREQWNDASNVLAIAPSEVIVYDRNTVTNDALREAGIIVHEIPSYELSRGRGGPRCMSMPLEREDI